MFFLYRFLAVGASFDALHQELSQREECFKFLVRTMTRQSSSVVEQRTHKPLVASSILASGTTL